MLTAAQKLRFDNTAPFEGLDKLLNQKKGVLKCKYSFASQGGAVSTILLLDENGDAALLPDKAIITDVYLDIITACVSAGGTGTIALNANSAGDLLAAVDADTLSGIAAGIPAGTAATSVKLTAARQIALAIATAALTAGVFDVYVEFVLGS